jgi:hypothetical protein
VLLWSPSERINSSLGWRFLASNVIGRDRRRKRTKLLVFIIKLWRLSKDWQLHSIIFLRFDSSWHFQLIIFLCFSPKNHQIGIPSKTVSISVIFHGKVSFFGSVFQISAIEAPSTLD